MKLLLARVKREMIIRTSPSFFPSLCCNSLPSRTSLRRWPHLVKASAANPPHHNTACIQRAEDNIARMMQAHDQTDQHDASMFLSTKFAFPEAALSRSRWRRAISSCLTVSEHNVSTSG